MPKGIFFFLSSFLFFYFFFCFGFEFDLILVFGMRYIFIAHEFQFPFTDAKCSKFFSLFLFLSSYRSSLFFWIGVAATILCFFFIFFICPFVYQQVLHIFFFICFDCTTMLLIVSHWSTFKCYKIAIMFRSVFSFNTLMSNSAFDFMLW